MRNRAGEVLIKKYSNRRLYDTTESKYITLDELTAIIRSGRDVRIVDAKTNEDLTQATLAQMILESGRAARLLPQPLELGGVRGDPRDMIDHALQHALRQDHLVRPQLGPGDEGQPLLGHLVTRRQG